MCRVTSFINLRLGCGVLIMSGTLRIILPQTWADRLTGGWTVQALRKIAATSRFGERQTMRRCRVDAVPPRSLMILERIEPLAKHLCSLQFGFNPVRYFQAKDGRVCVKACW